MVLCLPQQSLRYENKLYVDQRQKSPDDRLGSLIHACLLSSVDVLGKISVSGFLLKLMMMLNGIQHAV